MSTAAQQADSTQHFDVLIVGAGMVGSALACALADTHPAWPGGAARSP